MPLPAKVDLKGPRNMRKADQIAGAVILIFAGAVIFVSWQMPPALVYGRAVPGPGVGFLPLWIGILMAFFSILLIVTSWIQPVNPEEKPVMPGKQRFFKSLSLVVSMAVWILLMEVLGFIVATFLFSAFMLGVLLRVNWKPAVYVSVGTVIVLYLIFQILFMINLPKNMFGF
jgi:putative tricarboxylic transport membrane protein